MEKSTGILLLIAVAFRLLVLFFFSQSIFLTQLSISTFIVVMIIAIILLIGNGFIGETRNKINYCYLLA